MVSRHEWLYTRALASVRTIQSAIGAGGMGEVYRARDTRLDRTVAIKVLPPQLAGDPEFRERFDREARAISTLDHPHICALYDLGEQDGTSFLVMQYLEGETLADRLTKGAIPFDQGLRYAIEIASALDKAHRHGITHRDLKPGNIMLTKAGAKLLDFGLAKHGAGGPGRAGGAGEAPTMASPITAQGMILGTVQDMAPEQLEGREADARTDIFAFGAVVYEMVTGKKAFEGKSHASLIAAILEREPPFVSTAQPLTPPTLDRVVKKCLAKDPDDRWQSARDLHDELRWIAEARSESALSTAGASAVSRGRRSLPWALAAVAAISTVAAGTLGGIVLRRGSSTSDPIPVRRWTIAPPDGAAALALPGNTRVVAIAADGSRVVYRGNSGLIVRSLDRLEPTELSGLSDPDGVFFSPDGQWIGFSDNTTLKKIAIAGGAAEEVWRGDERPRGATWGDDGTIIFATTGAASGLFRVSAAGGQAAVLTTPRQDRGEGAHRWPAFLPGGRAVLFTIVPPGGDVDAAQLAVLDLQTGVTRPLGPGGSDARYVSSGHLVYGAAGTLRAVAFDLGRLEIVGTPTQVLPSVATSLDGAANFDVARDGTLVYVPAGALQPPRTLVWVDRQGREEAIRRAPPRSYLYPRISPDGMKVAIDIRDQQSDIWTWDFARETLTQITFDPALDQFPVWTHDGVRLVFSSVRDGGVNKLFSQSADGTGTIEPLSDEQFTPAGGPLPYSISPNGKWLVYRASSPSTGLDVMVVALDGDRPIPSPSPGVRVPGRSSQSEVQRPVAAANEQNGEISPDGDWIAYQSDESGQYEVYVRPFPNVGTGPWRVSIDGGTRPLWARTGQELFYVAPSGSLMAVGLELGANVVPGHPVKLLEPRYFMGLDGGNVAGRTVGGAGRTYDVSPNGQRFLMIKSGVGSEQGDTPPSIVVVQNWLEELKRLAPSK